MNRFVMTAGGGTSDIASPTKPDYILYGDSASLETGKIGVVVPITTTNEGVETTVPKLVVTSVTSGASAYQIAYTADEVKAKKSWELVLPRANANGGPIHIPFYRNNMTHKIMHWTPGANFSASVSLSSITSVAAGLYTITVCLKGVTFNERNKWTAQVYAKSSSTTLASIITSLVNQINSNTSVHGLTAAASSNSTITFTSTTTYNDYELILADELSGITATISTHGKEPIADATMVNEIARKCAADAGFRDTYQEPNNQLYPNYPFDALAGSKVTDYGFDIHILEFDEPRNVQTTTNENVRQTIYIACPRYYTNSTKTETTLSSNLTTILGGLC